jgi:hypothetical protein
LDWKRLLFETIFSFLVWRLLEPLFDYSESWLLSQPAPSIELLPSPTLASVISLVAAILIVFGVFAWRERDLEKTVGIKGIQAYLFFLPDSAESVKTLKHHRQWLHHRLIVNHKTTPPTAYYLSPDSFAWRLVEKQRDFWVAESDPFPEDANFAEKWCQQRGYKLIPRNPTRTDLMETTHPMPLDRALLLQGKEEQSKQEQATTTIPAKESTDFTLNDTAWVILNVIQGSFADSMSTEEIAQRTGLDRTLVFHTCVMLADHAYLKFTSVFGNMGLVIITATGLQAIRAAEKFEPRRKMKHNMDELIDTLDVLRARYDAYRKTTEPSSAQKLGLKFSAKTIAKRLDELDSKYADTWTLSLREQVQLISNQLRQFGESRQFFLIERFQETCELGEALSSALKRKAIQ